MRDKNGKLLKVGDQVICKAHRGLLTITSIDKNPEDGMEYLRAQTSNQEEEIGYDQNCCNEVEKLSSWKELAQAALNVQNASNLSGVANSFAQVVHEVRVRSEYEQGDDWRCHPIIQLWSDKIASLTGTQISWNAMKAYDWVHKQVENKG